MKKVNSPFRKSVTTLLAAVLMLTGTFLSCEKAPPVDPDTNAVSDSAVTDPSANSSDMPVEEETAVEIKPDGTIDSDADELDGITIESADELARIGTNRKYPLDGDYFLVADIDLSEVSNFTPIGGSESECGIVEGNNVFTGTFDGRGHTIIGLNITVSDTDRVHVGLFGSVGSKNKNDPAVIKNLILKDAEVTGNAKGSATYGILCGQVSGNAVVDNIAIISGALNVENESGDILGIGSLIGQCRTQSYTGCTNETIHITNIFTNVQVTGDNNGNANYTSGLIGRIRASDLGSLKNVIQLGSVTHEGGSGNAITGGDSKVRKLENVYYLTGCGKEHNGIGKAASYETLCGGSLAMDDAYWHLEEGMYPLLKTAYESRLFSILDFIRLNLRDGETEDQVESGFTLADEVMGRKITWKSSDDSVIRIDGGNAIVTKPEFGHADVTLTAYADGIMKTYDLRVFSGVVGCIERDGDNLIAKNYPDGVTFKWTVRNAATGASKGTITNTDGIYPLTAKDENGMITLAVDGYDDVFYYHSSLPTIYIDSDSAYYDISKGGYSDAAMTVVTTPDYPTTVYSGDIQIKLRGNSTAYQAKRPFHIKLGSKADMFGMGESKHWYLLANAYDRTNLRNKLSYDFGKDLGLASCDSIFVNLIYNGEYYGMYQFTETIRAVENRIEIFNWEEEAEDVAKAIAKKEGLSIAERDALEEKLTANLAWITSGKFGDYTISDYVDTSGYDITGGYLIENDYYYDEVTKFTTKNDMKLQLQNPEYLKSNSEMLNYLTDYIQDMEDAIYAPNRLNADGKHYSEYMDVDSFIDFWMVNEVFKNVELLYKSCYMYKDVGGLITWGPIWDMDWSSGNHVNLGGDGGKYNTWWHSESQDREYWYRALYNDPWFVLQLYERWGEIQGNIDTVMSELEVWNEKLADASAADNKRWRYDWTNEKEVNTLRQWLLDRREWMNQQMENPTTLMESFGYYSASKEIGITGLYEGSDYYDLYITINGDKIQSADLLINGKIVRTIDTIKSGDSIRIEASELRGEGTYNAIEILAKDADGNYLTIRKRSGQKGASAMEADYVYLTGK
ncbi:MAG: CotH kinase family protein [Clostridia bacterium]|nr:CotH kinase family protein [Clostridia bacterium]